MSRYNVPHHPLYVDEYSHKVTFPSFSVLGTFFCTYFSFVLVSIILNISPYSNQCLTSISFSISAIVTHWNVDNNIWVESGFAGAQKQVFREGAGNGTPGNCLKDLRLHMFIWDTALQQRMCLPSIVFPFVFPLISWYLQVVSHKKSFIKLAEDIKGKINRVTW